MEKKGIIFDIERFAIKDGPGIRTLVFMKGCPLECKWCANPESHNPRPEIFYYPNKCTGCGRCAMNCPENAITLDGQLGAVTDFGACSTCGLCVAKCFYDARKIVGKQFSVSQLMSEIMKDEPFYRDSGGGVTFSGGEPLIQIEFLLDLLSNCKAKNLHTAIETCGYASWESFQEVLPLLDLVFFDFKHIDAEKHRLWTGADNCRIMDNLIRVSDSFDNLVVRIPVIPFFNNFSAELKKMFAFLSKLRRVEAVELLPYHRLGSSKYKGLGREYGLEGVEALTPDDLEEFVELGAGFSLPVRVGTK
jgi:pyruvate formate lyase activating enzyme